MAASKNRRCEGCGIDTSGSLAHAEHCPARTLMVTDKRGVKNAPLPSAEELFVQQGKDKQAALEAQELLVRQAAEESERVDASAVYENGGLQGTSDGPPEVSVISVFVVMLHHDGTAAAGPLDMDYLARVVPTREVNASDMFKACSEVVKDIAAGDTAMAVVNYMQQASSQMLRQQMATQANRR